MPRRPRENASSGFYHVTLRGIGKRLIFEDNRDRIRFLNTIEKYADETGAVVVVYCLMDNHVHLMIHAKIEEMSLFLQKTEDSYSFFFNRKYNRTGPLFEGRFGSRTIETEDSLMRVVRYILNNPKKAGICAAGEYVWSNYYDFTAQSRNPQVQKILKIIGGAEGFKEFMKTEEDDENEVGIAYHLRMNDADAVRIVRRVLNGASPEKVAIMPAELRDEALRVIRKQGLSLTQISRLTGVSRSTVGRAVKEVRTETEYV